MKPILFIFSGLPAVGKSTLAKYIAQKYNAIYIRIDTIEQAIKNLCQTQVEAEGYELAYKLANDNLKLGIHVVADSCNSITITREAWEEVARTNNAVAINIEVICSDETEHKYRAETRQSEIGNLIPPSWQSIKNREYEPWSKERVLIDTANQTIETSSITLKTKIDLVLSSTID